MAAAETAAAGCGHLLSQTKSFGFQLCSSRWFMVFASLLIMAVNGSGYMFGLYSNDIKSHFGYDQTTLNLLSFFKDLGANLGVISGLVYEVSPPWLVLSIGAALNFFGFFMVWLAVTGRIAEPHLWEMCLYMFVGANSLSFPNTAALVTCVKNFPRNRGCVLGLLKGYIGLSGAIMTQLYHAIYGDDSEALILLIAWLPPAVSLATLPAIRMIKAAGSPQPNELKLFYSFLYISLGLAGCLMAVIINQSRLHFTRAGYVASASVVILFLFLPLAVAVNEEFKLFKGSKQESTNHDLPVLTEMNAVAQALQPQPANMKQGTWFKNIFKPPRRGEDYTVLQAVLSIDMAILFIATTCGVGGALTVIDNLGQIGTSLGYPTSSISIFVSLMSIWNFLGRVVAGYASELLLTKYKFPRPLMLTSVILLSCLGHLLVAFAVPNALYLASMITGFCLGAQLPLSATIISEIFGLKHYSTLYNVGSVSSPIGSYIFNVRVAGRLYDKEGKRQIMNLGLKRQPGQELTCKGATCYKISFLVVTAASVFGCLVSVILVLRTRSFYRGDIYGKFREARREEEIQQTVPGRDEERAPDAVSTSRVALIQTDSAVGLKQ